MWVRTAAGSWTCSIVCRNTTASKLPASPWLSTGPRSKRRLSERYRSRACSNASGLASTPTTDAAPRASTAEPYPAAGHVTDAGAEHPGADPLVDREVATEPVVLGGHVRQRALAGEGEWRHAGRLILLDVEVAHHAHRQAN